MKLHGLVALFPFALAAPAGAQFATESPSYQVGVVATGVAANGSSMAVDRFGNAFVVDRDPTAAGPYSVTRIAPDGTVTPSFASGLFAPGEAAYDPTDGLVYVVDVVSPAPAPGSNVLRLDPSVGPVVVGP